MTHPALPMAVPEARQVVTMSFFRYPARHRVWAMAQMWEVRKSLSRFAGVRFFKPVGTGGSTGYSIRPDLSVYGLLVVWEDESLAEAFLSSPLCAEHLRRSTEHFAVMMWPRRSKGSWSGFSGWECHTAPHRTEAMCTLTRATIKAGFLLDFWREVYPVSRAHENAEGLRFSKGIGEIPFVELATFSVWESQTAMEAFAYRGRHADAIAQTRRAGGFKEEMFTRFEPIRTWGTWNGTNPLEGLLEASPGPPHRGLHSSAEEPQPEPATPPG